MRLGFFLPQIGSAAGPEAISTIAKVPMGLGFDDLWVSDRLLVPSDPQVPYPAAADGTLPAVFARVLDPPSTTRRPTPSATWTTCPTWRVRRWWAWR